MMIKPHGSDVLMPLYVSDDAAREQLLKEAEALPSLLLNSAAAANAVMLGAGYFNPLQGFMNLADALAVAKDMHTTDGLFWPVPVINLTHETGITAGARVALRDPNVEGHPVLAVMDVTDVESVTDARMRFEQTSASVDGRKWSLSRPATLCISPMKSSVAWPWSGSKPMAALCTCFWAS